MSTNQGILKIITNDTKDSIASLEVVTPTIFSKIFSKFASNYDVDLENEEEITNTLLDEKIDIYTNIQEQTSSNAKKLSDNTDKAICAIKDKDEIVLNKILKETQGLREEIEKLKESIYVDELTHTHNRRWIHDNFLDIDNKKFEQNGTLALIDLNYFKIINDTHGHVIGDRVLQFIANELKKVEKNVVRYGGDEFIVIFQANDTKNDSFTKLDNLREDVLRKNLKVKDTSFKVSFSIGVCSFKKGEILTKVIELADKDMYSDKVKIKQKISGI